MNQTLFCIPQAFSYWQLALGTIILPKNQKPMHSVKWLTLFCILYTFGRCHFAFSTVVLEMNPKTYAFAQEPVPLAGRQWKSQLEENQTFTIQSDAPFLDVLSKRIVQFLPRRSDYLLIKLMKVNFDEQERTSTVIWLLVLLILFAHLLHRQQR